MNTITQQLTPEPATNASPDCAPPTGSVVFDGHVYRHPTHRAIYELMGEIEKLPGSVQQTKVVTLAGDLQNHVATMRANAATQAATLRKWAAECFPADASGQVHFTRALMEGVADELDEAFNPQNTGGQTCGPAAPDSTCDSKPHCL